MSDKRYGTRRYNWAGGQKISFTDTNQDTAAFDFDTEVAISVTEPAFITCAVAPTAAAAAGSLLIPAGVLFHLQVKAGEKISFVRQTDSGDAYVIPC
jgi:hypothetical protein